MTIISFYHFTCPKHLDSILRQGLLASNANADDATTKAERATAAALRRQFDWRQSAEGKDRKMQNGNLASGCRMEENMTQTDIIDHDIQLANIAKGVRDDETPKLLKFKSNTEEFVIGDKYVPVGTKYVAYPMAWTKTWDKFVDGKKVDQKIYPVARGKAPCEREELDDVHLIDSKGSNGKSNDPWKKQYYLPLEDVETEQLVVFVTNTWGGQEAVRDLVTEYKKQQKRGQRGNPIIQLSMIDKDTKHGIKKAPKFSIVGWDEEERSPPDVTVTAMKPVEQVAAKSDDMDDEIPF